MTKYTIYNAKHIDHMLPHLNYNDNCVMLVMWSRSLPRQMSVEQEMSVWNTFVMDRGVMGQISRKVM